LFAESGCGFGTWDSRRSNRAGIGLGGRGDREGGEGMDGGGRGEGSGRSAIVVDPGIIHGR